MSVLDKISEKSYEKSAISEATHTNLLDDITGSKTMPEVKWSAENEKIPSEWCDIAKCYKWLHNKAHQKYSKLHAWFTIPAIIFSTISGTASFAQSNFPPSMQMYAPMIIGSVNIIIGILTTIQQYMKISELNESHRVSGIAWDKFARNISIELAKAPEERIMDAGHFLKTYREEFDRLMETSPSIPQHITQEFVETFSGRKPTNCFTKYCSKNKDEDEKREEKELRKTKFKELKKPDECSTIMISETGKHDWYGEPEINIESIESLLSQKIKGIHENIKRSEEERRKNIEEKALQEEEKRRLEKEEAERKRKEQEQLKQAAIEMAQKKIKQTKIIENQIKLFSDTYGREPLLDELEDLLNVETLEQTIIQEFMKKYTPRIGSNNV
jgi:hypothetical protein